MSHPPQRPGWDAPSSRLGSNVPSSGAAIRTPESSVMLQDPTYSVASITQRQSIGQQPSGSPARYSPGCDGLRRDQSTANSGSSLRHQGIEKQTYRDLDDPRYQRRTDSRRRSRSPKDDCDTYRDHRYDSTDSAYGYDRALTGSLERPSPRHRDLRPGITRTVQSGIDILSTPSSSHQTVSSAGGRQGWRSGGARREAPSLEQAAKPSPTSTVTAANRKWASNISRWNQTQEELHQQSVITEASATPIRRTATSASSQDSRAQAIVDSASEQIHPDTVSEAQLRSFDYKDAEQIACLLCQRKFKSIDTLHRHEKESELHRTNLADLDVCRQGMQRKCGTKAVAGTEKQSSPNPSSSTAAPLEATTTPSDPTRVMSTPYRDRASERRAVFGADNPAPTRGGAHPNTARSFEGPAREEQTQPILSAPEKPIGSDNVGNRLLALMGWTQGQGLGASAQGRTDIVETKIYRPGAGLGSAQAESDAQAANNTTTSRRVAFKGYIEAAKDRARQELHHDSSQSRKE